MYLFALQETVSATGVVRPISPDLAIWKFSPTAYLHVGVRISGAVLASGFSLAGLYGLFVSCDIPHALDTLKINVPFLIPILKGCIAAPITYHFLGGVRQLYHDFTAKGLTVEFQDNSSYAIASVTAIATLYFAFAGI